MPLQVRKKTNKRIETQIAPIAVDAVFHGRSEKREYGNQIQEHDSLQKNKIKRYVYTNDVAVGKQKRGFEQKDDFLGELVSCGDC